MKVSVCILAKNEEEIIEDCINSVKNFAYEIIIIDNGSSDSTKNIAIKHGCIVKTCKEGVEADLRNEYLKVASGDWIFMIDADERVDELFSENLLKELENTSKDTYCYSLPVNSYYGNGKWAYFTTHRLFRNIKTIRYSGNKIHPTLRNSFQENGYIPKLFPYPIHHLDAMIKDRTAKKREGYIKKITQNMKIFNGTEDYYRLSCFLACEYLAIKNYDYAIEILQETSKKSNNYSDLSNLYLMNAYLLKKDFDSLKYHINTSFFNFIDIETRDSIEIFNILNESGLSYDILDKIIISICEYYLNLNDISNVLKWLTINKDLNPYFAHNYINLASITTNKELNNNLINYAIKLNPYLINPIIYKQGCEPNIYIHQTSLLSTSNVVFENINSKYI